MNNKYVLKNAAGLFYVEGAGFVAAKASEATTLCNDSADCTIACCSKLGITGINKVVASKSWAVVYIRQGEGIKLLNGGAKDPADANKGQVDPSKRRFATRDEAIQHGSRFDTRRKDRGDKPGTAGHEGFFVIETSDPVNAAVNWKTGLTNPLS